MPRNAPSVFRSVLDMVTPTWQSGLKFVMHVADAARISMIAMVALVAVGAGGIGAQVPSSVAASHVSCTNAVLAGRSDHALTYDPVGRRVLLG